MWIVRTTASSVAAVGRHGQDIIHTVLSPADRNPNAVLFTVRRRVSCAYLSWQLEACPDLHGPYTRPKRQFLSEGPYHNTGFLVRRVTQRSDLVSV